MTVKYNIAFGLQIFEHRVKEYLLPIREKKFIKTGDVKNWMPFSLEKLHCAVREEAERFGSIAI